MNLRTLLLIVCCIFVSFETYAVTIRGKIIGYDGKSIVSYHPTVEGIFTPYWQELKPASNGTFKIEFENEGFGNTIISYKHLHYKFFHDADSKIYFEINGVFNKLTRILYGDETLIYYDSIKQKSTLKIEGDYQAINQFYNQNLRGSYWTTRSVSGNYYSHLIRLAETPEKALLVLDSLRKFELDQIDRLPLEVGIEKPEQKNRDREIQDFLTNEVNTFYSAIFLNGMFLKRRDHIYRLIADSTSNPNIYNREWEVLIEKLYENTITNLTPIPNSSSYNDFIEALTYTMSAYQQYSFPQDPTISLDQMVVDKLFNYDTILIKDSQSRLSYQLGALQRYLNDQLFYSPILLHAVYELQDQYPESENLKHYQLQIDKIKNSLEAAKSDFSKAKIIEANHSTFSSLIKRFKGQNLLIDIWATWCHPCIDEFKYKNNIQPFREKSQLEVLFISIDKKQWDDRWRQSIKINELEGIHFRADPKFITDMWSAIGDFQGAIPRYVLIDKEGNIFKSTAARPGNGTELVEQIEAMVNKR